MYAWQHVLVWLPFFIHERIPSVSVRLTHACPDRLTSSDKKQNTGNWVLFSITSLALALSHTPLVSYLECPAV